MWSVPYSMSDGGNILQQTLSGYECLIVNLPFDDTDVILHYG